MPEFSDLIFRRCGVDDVFAFKKSFNRDDCGARCLASAPTSANDLSLFIRRDEQVLLRMVFSVRESNQILDFLDDYFFSWTTRIVISFLSGPLISSLCGALPSIASRISFDAR